MNIGEIERTPDAQSRAREPVSATAHPKRQRHGAGGRFLPLRRGEVAASQTHAFYAKQELLDHLADVETYVSQCVADDGGETNITTRRRSQIENRARIQNQIARVDGAIKLFGLFDKKGRMRERWVALLCTLVEKARAIDALLGLERRQRDLGDIGIEEYAALQELREREQRDNAHTRDDSARDTTHTA
jgi:hypothetical protein